MSPRAKASMPSDDNVVDEVKDQPQEIEVDTEDKDDDLEPDRIEDLPPETELWPEGPTAKQVVEWKEQFGDVYVTSITLDKHIIWRPMFRPEYIQLVKELENLVGNNKISQTEANMYNEERMCEMCCLFPKFVRADFVSELAGLPSILSQQITEASGFTSIDVRQL